VHPPLHSPVIPLRGISVALGRPWCRFLRCLVLLAGIAHFVVAATGAAETSIVRYSTAGKTDERVMLADGSVVELNGNTELEARFTNSNRAVTLLQGEAFFAVVKDLARPFEVSAGGVAVKSVEATFNVRLDQSAMTVLVTKGRAEVGRPGKMPIILQAGSSVVISLGAGARTPAPAALTPTQISQAHAWQPRRFDFHNTPLARVVATINANAPTGSPRLVVEDAALAATPIGGSIRPDEIDAFLRLIDITLNVSADRRGDVILLRRSR
jgi:transmembrane sensor